VGPLHLGGLRDPLRHRLTTQPQAPSAVHRDQATRGAEQKPATVDPRPGGKFETIMVNDADGAEYPMYGVFVDVVEPEKLVWTERDVEGGMTTSITFKDLGDGRTETVTHQTNVPEMFRSPEAQAGLQSSFDRFDAYLATL